MSSRNGSNFFTEHWDWLSAAAGLAAVAVAVWFGFLAPDDDGPSARFTAGAAADERPAVDLQPFERVLAEFTEPVQLAPVDATNANFLASGARFFCAPVAAERKGCGKPIRPGLERCPYCDAPQKAEKEQRENLDTDGDGLTDVYELKYGLDPKTADSDQDKDGDGFTNLEEFEAGTNPADPKDHPDYLDSLELSGQLKENFTTLMFTGCRETPSGLKYEFKDPKYKNDYSRGNFSVYAGEPIGKTGFVARKYVQKTRQVVMGGGMKKTVDDSSAIVERTADGKQIELKIDVKRTPTDEEGSISCPRVQMNPVAITLGSKFVVAPGWEYKVLELKKTGKGVAATVESVKSGRRRNFEALEQ